MHLTFSDTFAQRKVQLFTDAKVPLLKHTNVVL